MDALLDLTASGDGAVPTEHQLSPQWLADVQGQAQAVVLSDDLRALLKDLRAFLEAEGVVFSDRRLRKIVGLLRVAAYTDGRSTATVWDAYLVQHCAWDDPSQRQAVADWWAARVGTLRATSPRRLVEMVSAWEARLSEMNDQQAQQVDEQGRLLFEHPDGSLTIEDTLAFPQTTRSGEALYLAPPLNSYEEERASRTKPDGSGYTQAELADLDLWDDGGQFFRSWAGANAYLADPSNRVMTTTTLSPAMGAAQQQSSHVAGWLAQIDEVIQTVVDYLDGVDARDASLSDVRTHLWLTESVADRAAETLQQSRSQAEELQHRLTTLRAGFEALPVQS